MTEMDARFEYRAFARDLGAVDAAFRALSPVTRERQSRELYVVSTAVSDHNVKVRGGVLDIKVRIACDHGLEQWHPLMKADFPLSRQILLNEVLPLLGVSVSDLERDAYAFEQFAAEIVGPHPALMVVDVSKTRVGFEIGGCVAEVADVTVGGVALQTACLESVDAERVLAACERTGLNAYDNVNYVHAVKRVVGLEQPPFETP